MIGEACAVDAPFALDDNDCSASPVHTHARLGSTDLEPTSPELDKLDGIEVI